MGRYRIVKEGEHVPRIAAAEGFRDFASVWNDPSNAALRRTREPCVLNPGDELYVPDRETKALVAETGKTHEFVVRQTRLHLHLVVRDLNDEPLSSVPCELRIGSRTEALTLDGSGELDRVIPIQTESCELQLPDRTVGLLVGHLDPVDKPAGQRARLSNLGFYAPDSEHDSDEDERSFRSAVEEFQCDHGLIVDGKCGTVTQAKLKAIHGS